MLKSSSCRPHKCNFKFLFPYILKNLLLHGTRKMNPASQLALVVKNLPAKAGAIRDVGLIPGLGRSPGGGHATHFSTHAWRIPWTEEPGGLWSIVLQRVRLDQSNLACMHAQLWTGECLILITLNHNTNCKMFTSN